MNDTIPNYSHEQEQTVKFFEGMFGRRTAPAKDRRLSLSAEPPVGRNQPEFWADAPWRMEPDQHDLPLLFLVRDAGISYPAKGPWRLDTLMVEQRMPDDSWEAVRRLLPVALPGVDAAGNFQRRTWTHQVKIPLAHFRAVDRGDTLHLRVVFQGSYYPHEKPSRIEIHLEVFLAQFALPQSRAESASKPRQWFYGDTHYHSAYTNDIKEIGNPVPESCAAAHAIGLDWLIITDHSCDLDDVDPDVSPQRRWDRLKAEVSSPAVSHDQFRCLLGEEITLLGKDENLVHMLAFGNLAEMVEGAFLPDEGGFMTEVFQKSLGKWLDKVAREGGYPLGETQRLFGKVHPFEDVMALLPEETLTFAAHPFQMAQPPPPGKWDNEHLYHPRLTGFEFWNGRSRRSTKMSLNPFSRKDWQDPAEQVKQDEKRITKLRNWAEDRWDLALRRGLANWDEAESLPSLRPVFLAGSDAHGSFNYSVGMSWDYRRRLIVDDNALGKVRTVLYLPESYEGVVPPEEKILAAIRKGSCVVTDGPLLNFNLAHGGKIAHLGEALTVTGDGDIRLELQTFSTPEFGPVARVELVTCFRHYRKVDHHFISQGETVTLPMAGLQGYCRLYAQTEGPDGQLYCCFTNPIWVRVRDGKLRKIIAIYP